MERTDFELVVGCMKAGKSKYLIDCYVGSEIVEAYKPAVGTASPNAIISRAYTDNPDMQLYCQQVSTLYDVNPTRPIVIVDEFQFFNTKELRNFVLKCKHRHHKLVMAGLDLLADGTEWSAYAELKPMADKITKLRAKCSICCHPAEYTQCIAGDRNPQIQLEGQAIYEPRCKKHFDRSK